MKLNKKHLKHIFILLLFIIAFPSISYSEICKSAYHSSSSDCGSICQNVLMIGSMVQYKTHYETELKGNTGSLSFFSVKSQKRCVCIYEPTGILSDDLGSSYSVCEYTVTEVGDVKPVTFAQIDFPNKPVNNLIKMATLQPTNFGSSSGQGNTPTGTGAGGKLGFASSIIASVYYKGLHYFSSYYALILLTILFAGTLFLFGFGNFFTILKAPQQIWSLLTGTDFKSKSAQVILAIVFFGLPVDIDIVYSSSLSSNNNSSNNNATQQSQQYSSLSNLIFSNNVLTHCRNRLEEMVRAEVKWHECIAREQQHQVRNQNQNNQNQQQNQNNPGLGQDEDFGDIQFQNQYSNIQLQDSSVKLCENEEQTYYRKYNELIECSRMHSNNDATNDASLFGGQNNNGTSGIDSLVQRRDIRDKLQVPFATVIVAGFVNFGVGVAEKIATWANASVKNYFYYKLVYNNEMSLTSLQNMSTSSRQLNNVPFTFELKIPNNVKCGNIQGSFKDCSEIEKAIQDINSEYEKGYCLFILKDALARCQSQYNLVTQFNKAIQNSELEITQQLHQRYSEAMNSIESNFSFLSPALIPMVIITYPFQQLGGKQPQQVVSAEKVTETHNSQLFSAYASYSPILLAQSAYNWGANVYNKAKTTIRHFYNLATMSGNESNIMDDEVSKIIGTSIARDKRMAYWLGYASIITAIPPGAQIKSFLQNIFTKLFEAVGSMLSVLYSVLSLFVSGLGFVLGFIKGGFLFSIVLSTLIGLLSIVTGKLISNLASIVPIVVDMVITYIAVNITVMILIMLPFFAIVIAGVVRFIHYIYEIMKTMIALPFYALPVATRRAEGAFIFFGDLVKLSILPVLIASGVVFALFFALVVEYFLFDLPFSLVLSQIIPDSYASLFLFGIIIAALQVMTTFVTTYYLYKITMNFPEYIINAISRLVGLSQSTYYYEAFAERAFSHAKMTMLARV